MKINFESLDYYFKNPFHDMKNLTEQNIAELRQAQEILNRVLPLTEFEESLKPKPIPHGTLCLVADTIPFFQTKYSDGAGNYYYCGKLGQVDTWKHAIPFTPEMQQIVEDYIINN